jgi:succinoglycan biosynthesis transport protein ExoP
MVYHPQPTPPEAGYGLEDGLSARALLSSIRRHFVLVSVLCLSFAVMGAGIGLGLPHWFQAEAVLIVKARPQRIADVQELPDPTPDLYVMRSEVDMLQSRSVIEPVVRSLELWRFPEFQEHEYPGGWTWKNVQAHFFDLFGIASRPKDDVRMSPDRSSLDADTPTQAVIDQTIEKYGGYLTVGTDGRSVTIRVSYRAWTPERAATIVNAHIESYQNLQEQAKLKAANRANSALTAQIVELRKQLGAAEAAVTRYREDHKLTGAAKDSGTLSAQLASLNNQLISTRADLAENEARATRIGAAAKGKGGADSVPEVIASGTISMLRGQEAQLLQREADLSKDHGEAYPELRRVRASLQTLKEQISREIGRSHAAALQLVERSRTRERSIQQSIVELTNQVNSSDAGLQQLQGKADSIRTVLRDFERRVEETATNPAFIISNSTVASRANPSAAWTLSKTRMIAFASGFVGLTLGTLLSVLFEIRDRTFRTSTQVEQQIGSLRVGSTPRVRSEADQSPAEVVLTDQWSVIAEAFRLSWANIHFAMERSRATSLSGNRIGMALGITSAATGEGKSTHALAFARTAALAGEKVILVDADLRRSGLSRLLNESYGFTLQDYLEGRCTADEVIAIEERSGIRFVPSTSLQAPWTSTDMRRFSILIDYLKDRFAVVVVDLPPILGLAETTRLSAAMDGIVLIIRWARTERQFVQFALDALRDAGVVATAAVLNDIDLRTQQRRGYRDRTVVVYADECLYRAVPGKRKRAESVLATHRETAANADGKIPANPRTDPLEVAEDSTENTTNTGSDIQRLYERYHR